IRLRGADVPTLVLGFVDNMADLMYASDVVVTKAGPGTISEALACQVPIIISGAIPGQEMANVAYVRQHGVGQSTASPDEVVEAVRQLSSGSSPALTAMRARAKQLSNPHASFHIAEMILSYLPSE